MVGSSGLANQSANVGGGGPSSLAISRHSRRGGHDQRSARPIYYRTSATSTVDPMVWASPASSFAAATSGTVPAPWFHPLRRRVYPSLLRTACLLVRSRTP